MVWRYRLSGALPVGLLLLACATHDPVGSGGGGGGGGGGPPLEPAEFNASVNATPPAGYSISGDQPYEWQAYIRYGDAWVPVGGATNSVGPAVHLAIDCNDPAMHHACTLHLSGLIQVTVTQVSPGPTRLCAYKSGLDWYDGLLLNTPLGTMSPAPVASSSQDPANEGICFP